MNMDFAALSKMAKEAGAKAKVAATRMAEQAKERLEDTEGNKQLMQQFAEKVGRTLDEFIDDALDCGRRRYDDPTCLPYLQHLLMHRSVH